MLALRLAVLLFAASDAATCLKPSKSASLVSTFGLQSRSSSRRIGIHCMNLHAGGAHGTAAKYEATAELKDLGTRARPAILKKTQ
jgi:hypothetical protein